MVAIHETGATVTGARTCAGAVEDRIYLLQEEGRPGEYMPAYEDEHGTYIMNSKDLRAIQHVRAADRHRRATA